MNISTTKIEALLAERGLTKTALAESCGISRQNISTIVRRGPASRKQSVSSRRDWGSP